VSGTIFFRLIFRLLNQLMAFFARLIPVGCGVSGTFFFRLNFGMLNQLLAFLARRIQVGCGVTGTFFFRLIFGLLNQLLVFFAPRPPSTLCKSPSSFSTDTKPSTTTKLNQLGSFRKYSLELGILRH
jgi:hypothetical protein